MTPQFNVAAYFSNHSISHPNQSFISEVAKEFAKKKPKIFLKHILVIFGWENGKGNNIRHGPDNDQ